MKAVLVTTAHRGVFFGFIEPATEDQKTIVLAKVRCCLYWHESIGGFLGLASVGPNDKCRVGKEAPRVILHDVTSVSDVTEEAVKRWAAA